MIQFNLLPDVKVEFLKARRTKRLVILSAAVIASLSLAILLVLGIGTLFIQKNHLKNLQADIDSSSKQLQDEPELNKILTIQNQLKSLDGLHENKPAAERLGEYLSQITPSDTSISSLDVDFVAHTMTFNGTADSLKSVNKFVDTLKFTSYKTGDNSAPAFSSVVLASFGRGENAGQATPATYQITASYDAAIFNGGQDVKLVVPKTVTTRSSTEKPTDLFQPQSNQKATGDQ